MAASQRQKRCSCSAPKENAHRKVLLSVGVPLGELVERVSLHACHAKQQAPSAERVSVRRATAPTRTDAITASATAGHAGAPRGDEGTPPRRDDDRATCRARSRCPVATCLDRAADAAAAARRAEARPWEDHECCCHPDAPHRAGDAIAAAVHSPFALADLS